MKCEEQCFNGARFFSSHKCTLEYVLKECLKDEAFYVYHGGGVTLSGGEPLLQSDFCFSLLHSLKSIGISTAVETAGYVNYEAIEKVIEDTDVFYYDVKLIDRGKRKKYLGSDSNLMLDNLVKLSRLHDRIVIRIPLIPGVNDSETEYIRIMKYIKSLGNIRYVQIMPFHQLGMRKYELADINYEMKDIDAENTIKINKCSDIAKSYGFEVNIGGGGFVYELRAVSKVKETGMPT